MVKFAGFLGQRRTSRLFVISQKRIFEWGSQKLGGILDLVPSAAAAVAATTTTTSSQESTETLASGSFVPSQVMPVAHQQSLRAGPEGTLGNNDNNCGRGGGADLVGGRRAISVKSSRQIRDIAVEREVFDWFQRTLADGSKSTPTSSEIRSKALEMYRAKGYQDIKCSYGWYRRWCARFRCGAPSHEDRDPGVLSWLLQQYDNNHLVSHAELRSFALQAETGPKVGKSRHHHYHRRRCRPDFKASPGWAARLLKRHHILLNWDGLHGEPLPPDLEQAAKDYLDKLGALGGPLADTKFRAPTDVGCMDEVPLSFAGSTWKCRSSATSSAAAQSAQGANSGSNSRVRRISIRNCDATVLLALRADGLLLPPMVIVKAQNASSLDQVYAMSQSSPVLVYYGKTTEPTLSCLDKWLTHVWLKSVGGGGAGRQSLLFWDSYELHAAAEASFEKRGVACSTFPPGCSAKLQPLNVSARLRFSRTLERCWEEHLSGNEGAAEIRLPTTDEMVQWVALAHSTIVAEDSQSSKLGDSFRQVGLCRENSKSDPSSQNPEDDPVRDELCE